MKYRANAKLLLSGEYIVLKGASALSIPTKYGQELLVSQHKNKFISIRSYDINSNLWFQAKLNLDLSIQTCSSEKEAQTIQKILLNVQSLGADIKNEELIFNLDFDRNWGLGTSSTLIDLLAQHYKIDPLRLFFKSLRGSGYDVAQASINNAILYELNHQQPKIKRVQLSGIWEEGFFIYLGQKQNSDIEVRKFNELSIPDGLVTQINTISNSLASCDSKDELIRLLAKHESLLSIALGRESIHSKYPDFHGTIKSLGAWGGDFAFAIGDSTEKYFSAKGYDTIIPFMDMFYSNSN